MSDRRVEFAKKVKVKRLTFAEFKCEGIVTRDDVSKVRCDAVLVTGRVEFDHDIAAELGGPATFENCRALCLLCHRAKYPDDAAKISQAKRRERANLGVRTAPARPMQSAAMPVSERTAAKRERGPKQPLPPRSLYR